MKTRRKFTREFKLAAVKKVVEQRMSIPEVARDLSICDSMLRQWKAKFEAEGAIGTTPNQSQDDELQRLREENRRLKAERDILKKATAFFANQNP